MKKIRLSFANFQIEFADRDLALRRVEEWAERGMTVVHVVYGPEGCGKTAWLRQSAVLLRELGFHVIYVDALHRYFEAYTDVKEVAKKLAEAAAEAVDIAQLKLATLAIDLAKELIKRRKRKVAVLAEDVFSAIGLDKAAIYVKGLLGLIEYPPGDYDAMITIATTSEGASKREIGRHRWAYLDAMWNMPRDGFKQLYDQLPGEKPPFDDVWKTTGGNPKLLGQLYEFGWDVEKLVQRLVEDRELASFSLLKWGSWLKTAVEDPDVLWSPDTPRELVEELIRKNLIIYNLHSRDPYFWIDVPPPEKDLGLCIGKHVAWQTPLHKEAVKRVLTQHD
ncbi:MAG: ATP-binding protein [Pyrobaculum sp.]